MLLTVMLALGGVLQPGADSIFESELWPGEGRPVFVAVARELVLQERPTRSAKVIKRLPVAPKQRLEFGHTRYRTIKAGRLVVLVSSTIEGRLLGATLRLTHDDYYSDKFVDASVEVSAGITVEYLQYRAEGTCFVRVAGKTLEADTCPTEDLRRFRLEAHPIVEWWIHIIVNGTAAGWLLVTDDSVKEVWRQG